MSFALLGRRALAPAGGVATVASMSMIAWTGERSVANISPRIVSKAGESAYRNLYLRQQCYKLSSKPAAPASTQTPPTAKPPVTERTTTASTSATSAKAATEKKSSGSFVDWYEGHLEARPVLTKMCTGAFLWGLGDVVAQVIPPIAAKKENKDAVLDFQYDLPRTGRAVVYGFGIHAPIAHVHYNFLEWMTNRAGVTGLAIPIFKTVMEQFVYWGWVSNAMYLAAMGAFQGHSPTKIYDKIHDSIWGLMIAQWAFWIPVQLLNFQFVPVRHQLNVVLITSVVWTALLSFWYPPESESLVEEAVKDDDKDAMDKKEN